MKATEEEMSSVVGVTGVTVSTESGSEGLSFGHPLLKLRSINQLSVRRLWRSG